MVEADRDMRYYYQDQVKNIRVPKTFSEVPETYKVNQRQMDKLVPDSEKETFEQRLYFDFMHRECFKACQNKKNDTVSEKELSCFVNCQSKHSLAAGIFSNVTMFLRRQKGTLGLIDYQEYENSPEEMGKYYPTDVFLKHSLLKQRYENEMSTTAKRRVNAMIAQNNGNNLLTDYLEGRGERSESRENLFLEYTQLKNKYADKLNAKYSGADWEEIDGEDFSPE